MVYAKKNNVKRIKKTFIFYSTILLSFLLSACVVGPDYNAPEIKVPDVWNHNLGESFIIFSDEEGKQTNIDELWWQKLNDDILNSLIDNVSDDNKNGS